MRKSLRCAFAAFAIVGVVTSPAISAYAEPTDITTPVPEPPPVVIDEQPVQAPSVEVPSVEQPQAPPVEVPAPPPVAPAPAAPPVQAPQEPPVEVAEPELAPAPEPALDPPVQQSVPDISGETTTQSEPSVPIPQEVPDTVESEAPSVSPSAPQETEGSLDESSQPPVSQPGSVEPDAPVSDLPEEDSAPADQSVPTEDTTEPESEPSATPSPPVGDNSTPEVSEPSATTATVEPPALPDATTVQAEPEADLVPEASLELEPLAVPEVAPPETVSDVESVFAAYRSSEKDKHDRDRGKDGRDHDWRKKDRDPKGWKCDDRRGPHACKWDDWKHDDRNRPVFYNRYSFDIKVLYFDHHSGQRVEVIVKAGTRRPIDVRHPGDYGFVVVGASSHNFALNVAVGTFSRGEYCAPSRHGHHCQKPHRPVVKHVDVRVYVNNVVYPRWPVQAYYCGCDRDNVVIYQDNRTYNYQRIFINGTREVVGTWSESPGKPRYFVPKGYKQSPVDQNYTWGTPPEFQGVVGGDNPSGENVQAAPVVSESPLRDAALVGVAVFVIVAAVGGSVWVWRRRQGTGG